jgi:hypothetical protein
MVNPLPVMLNTRKYYICVCVCVCTCVYIYTNTQTWSPRCLVMLSKYIIYIFIRIKMES